MRLGEVFPNVINLLLFCAKYGIKRLTEAQIDDIDDMTSLT